MKFDACILGGELPLGRGGVGVSAFDPSGRFRGHGAGVGQTPVQALAGQHAEFRFGHVQPTAVLGRVRELKLVQQPARLRRRKRLVQRGAGVGVEVVHHQRDPLGLGENPPPPVGGRLRPRSWRRDPPSRPPAASSPAARNTTADGPRRCARIRRRNGPHGPARWVAECAFPSRIAWSSRPCTPPDASGHAGACTRPAPAPSRTRRPRPAWVQCTTSAAARV